eukprot:g43927.t1
MPRALCWFVGCTTALHALVGLTAETLSGRPGGSRLCYRRRPCHAQLEQEFKCQMALLDNKRDYGGLLMLTLTLTLTPLETEKGLTGKGKREGSRITSVATAALRTLYKGKRGGDWDTATALDMSFPLEEERYQLTTVQRRGNVGQGESHEEAYDGEKQFKEWRRAVLLRLGEKGLEGALKPVDEHYLMVHEDNVTALQSKGKEVPKYMWLWEEWYGDREKENENEEEESVREVSQTRKDREETEVRSPLTMKQSTPSVADKRASTRLKEAVERLRKAYNTASDTDPSSYPDATQDWANTSSM